MNKDREELLNKIIDDVRGTAQDLGDVCEVYGVDYDSLTKTEHQHIDQYIFKCEECDWWCGDDEMSEHKDGVCDDCA